MGKLDGKVVIVTGASRGIGAEIAALFAKEGGKVVCAARTVHEGDHALEGSLERPRATPTDPSTSSSTTRPSLISSRSRSSRSIDGCGPGR